MTKQNKKSKKIIIHYSCWTMNPAGGGDLQHGLLHHLLCGDDPQAGCLRSRQICQRWIQRIRWFHRHTQVWLTGQCQEIFWPLFHGFKPSGPLIFAKSFDFGITEKKIDISIRITPQNLSHIGKRFNMPIRIKMGWFGLAKQWQRRISGVFK